MAKFQKGQSGNPKGRPRGSVDEKKAYIRDWVISIIGSNGKRLEQNFSHLSPKEQWRVIPQLLPYVLPRQHEAILDASIDANVHTPEPVILRVVTSKKDLEEIEKEIPDIEDSTNEQNSKE